MNIVISTAQSVLYILYFWFSLGSIFSSESMSELQRNPSPEGTPLDYLLEGVMGFSNIVTLMIVLVVVASRVRLTIRPLLIVNIILASLAILLRLFPTMMYFDLSGELVYLNYIFINEAVFYFFDVTLIVFSIYHLRKAND